MESKKKLTKKDILIVCLAVSDFDISVSESRAREILGINHLIDFRILRDRILKLADYINERNHRVKIKTLMEKFKTHGNI